MLKILQSLSLAGGEKNIDLIRATDECILLLDGSTPLIKSNYDASRFTLDFADTFFERVAKGERIPSAINTALSDVYKLFKRETADDNTAMYPSACLLVAYISEGRLHIINIGDTTALIVMADGSVKTVTCGDVRHFDRGIIARAMQIKQERGIDVCNIMELPEIRQMLMDNRSKMNTPDGYRILAFDMTDVDESEVLCFDPRDIKRVVLHSDGFDGYAAELTVPDADLSKIYASLRKKEKADARLNLDPRFKISDDASAVIFTVE